MRRHAEWHAKHRPKEPSKRRKLAAKRAHTEVERVFAIFDLWRKRE